MRTRLIFAGIAVAVLAAAVVRFGTAAHPNHTDSASPIGPADVEKAVPNSSIVERREITAFIRVRGERPKVQTIPAGAAEPNATDLQFKVQVGATEVLPYQTVRVTARVVNVSNKRLGPLPPLHDPIVHIVSPEGERLFAGHEVAGAPPTTMICCGFDPHAKDRLPIYLEAGCATNLSFPLVTHRTIPATFSPPYFAEPGAVETELRYDYGPMNDRGDRPHRSEQKFIVRVATPTGIDAEVVEELRKHPAAASALTAYEHEISEATAAKLGELLEKFPRSSYADYFRLAIARGLWGGDASGSGRGHGGDVTFHQHASQPHNFGRLTVLSNLDVRPNSWMSGFSLARQYGMLTSDFKTSDLPPIVAERDAAQADLLRLNRLQHRLATMSGTSLSRRRRIVELLSAIDRERFPLAPVATYYLARTLSIDDPQAGAGEFERLATRYADAYEWLHRIDHGSLSPNDWTEYRGGVGH